MTLKDLILDMLLEDLGLKDDLEDLEEIAKMITEET